MSIEIIDSQQTWENWNNAGSGTWRMWFMAPYGQWIYAAWVQNNTVLWNRINTATLDQNYTIASWDMTGIAAPPSSVFTNETSAFGPDGAIGMAVIRGTTTPMLYLAGRDNPEPDKDCVIHKFNAATFEAAGASVKPLYAGGGARIEIDQMCGFEVDPGNAFYLVTNNRNGREFEIRRFAYTFSGAELAPSHTVTLSDTYMQNNSLGRIRGIATAVDENILLFVNDGLANTSCRCIKFHKDTLAYLGQTAWNPSLPAGTWARVVQQADAFLFFRGLNEQNVYSWKNAVYYDRSTQIPNTEHSNMVISDNVMPFNNDIAVEIQYIAKDDFGVAVDNVSAKFLLNDFDPAEPGTWNEETPALKNQSSGDFFTAAGIPLEIEVTVTTDANGIAKAYYKSPREGTGSKRFVVKVTCPAV